MSPVRNPAGAGAVPIDPALARLAADLRGLPGLTVRVSEPMARHTTMRVGGPADLAVIVRDASMLAAVVRMARTRGVFHLLVGRGSDLVVADAGIRGLAILVRNEEWRIDGERLIAGAGLPLARAATEAQRAGLLGLEFGVSIPGTVGGAIWANAGAHGSDVAAVLEAVTLLDSAGNVGRVAAADLALAYRDSRLKSGHATASGHPTPSGHATGSGSPGAGAAGVGPSGSLGPAEVVLDATFRLARAEPEALAARMTEIRRWRREHQPLSLPSAGSVFRNPPGDSAGHLIDECGLKGTSVGGARISEMHANFIVNAGGATAEDVRRLADMARAEVRRRFRVDLVFEVQFAGDWTSSATEER